jgi:hypothetical protein
VCCGAALFTFTKGNDKQLAVNEKMLAFSEAVSFSAFSISFKVNKVGIYFVTFMSHKMTSSDSSAVQAGSETAQVLSGISSITKLSQYLILT